MRVFFIYPDVGTLLPADYQHGVGTLIAALRAAGREASLLYAHEEFSREALIAEAKKFSPDLVAISAVTNQYPRAVRYASWLKEELGVLTVIGGAHATLAAEETIARPCFDFLCRGEGEGAMVELAEALTAGRDPSGIQNLWMKRGREIIRNPVRPLLEDLDALPFVDREAFRFEWILREQEGKCSMLSGRGCPYGCTYCANEGLRKLYSGHGRFVRMRSVGHVLAEMKAILARYEVKKWEFNDDIFTLKRSWLEQFCSEYPKAFNIPFDVNVRVETVNAEDLKKLKAAGCDLVRVGVESGSERVRRELMGRPMAAADIERVFREAEAAGLKTWSFNMTGLPGETPEDAEETYRLNERLCPDHMQVSVFNPYPGTRLYEVCKERGVLTGRTMDGYFLPDSVITLPEYPPAAIHDMHQRLIRLRDICSAKKRLARELCGQPPAFDFVSELAGALVTTPEPRFVGEDYFWIGDDTRRVLRAHPPAKIQYQVRVPPRAELRFSLAMHPQVLARGAGGGVIFTVRIGRRSRRLTEIYRRVLDPKGKGEDRGWSEAAISLEPWAGKKVFLEFETRTVDPQHPDHNTVGFGYPLILEKK